MLLLALQGTMTVPVVLAAVVAQPDAAAIRAIDMGQVVTIAFFVLGGTVAVVAMIMSTIRKTTLVREREQTKREIAAYVAEGSITPADAERLLRAANDVDVRTELASQMAWGAVSAKQAAAVLGRDADSAGAGRS